jgi:hypothetical protein
MDGVEYEVMGWYRRAIGRWIVYPLSNYVIPRRALRYIIARSRSPIAQASLRSAGGWESMMIAYDRTEAGGLVDKWARRYGAFPMAVRNRRKLCHKTLSRLLAKFPAGATIVAVGAGPGANVLEPVASCKDPARRDRLFCIDLKASAFDPGRRTAEALGILDRVEFIEGDAVDVAAILSGRGVTPHVAVLVGILEYLTDDRAAGVLRVLHDAMPADGAVMASTLHSFGGLDRALRKAFDFDLVYRDVAKVSGLLAGAAFSGLEVDSEPMGIYDTVVGYKR